MRGDNGRYTEITGGAAWAVLTQGKNVDREEGEKVIWDEERRNILNQNASQWGVIVNGLHVGG